MQRQNNKISQIYKRPWGTYQTLDLGEGYQVKKIIVNPSGRLSLQKHQKRSEHWVVIQGNPTITVEETVRKHKVGDAIFIPIKSPHRLENFTSKMAALIEVQIGTYLGEDDIVRLEDIYGREVEK